MFYPTLAAILDDTEWTRFKFDDAESTEVTNKLIYREFGAKESPIAGVASDVVHQAPVIPEATPTVLPESKQEVSVETDAIVKEN